MDDDGNGGYQIKFIPKKNVPEAIGVPHTANEVTEQDETTESVDITFTKKRHYTEIAAETWT